MPAQHTDTILIVEDHRDIAAMVCEYFENCGYAVDYAADGVTGLHLAVSQEFDCIILDLMLPGMDGITVCRKLREEARKSTPVLMLTARDTLEDKLTGLDCGADDYLVKPFELAEVEARARALIRRNRGLVSPETLQVADLTLDTGTLRVFRAGQEISLTPIGLKILTILMRASPRVVSRREIEREIWGEILPDSDTLRSHVYGLRKAIDRPFETALLKTIPSTGYRVAGPDDN